MKLQTPSDMIIPVHASLGLAFVGKNRTPEGSQDLEVTLLSPGAPFKTLINLSGVWLWAGSQL
jgi:hypothetical protein